MAFSRCALGNTLSARVHQERVPGGSIRRVFTRKKPRGCSSEGLQPCGSVWRRLSSAEFARVLAPSHQESRLPVRSQCRLIRRCLFYIFASSFPLLPQLVNPRLTAVRSGREASGTGLGSRPRAGGRRRRLLKRKQARETHEAAATQLIASNRAWRTGGGHIREKEGERGKGVRNAGRTEILFEVDELCTCRLASPCGCSTAGKRRPTVTLSAAVVGARVGGGRGRFGAGPVEQAEATRDTEKDEKLQAIRRLEETRRSRKSLA